MKLSVFAVLLAEKSFDEACKYLADAGVQAVEIGCGGFPGKAHCDAKDFLAHPEKIEEMKGTLKKYNQEIAALSTHGNPVHPNKEIAQQFHEDFENAVLLAEKLGVKNATLMWPVRIAAAGKLVTPGGAVEICHILGKEETLRRLKLGVEKLTA